MPHKDPVAAREYRKEYQRRRKAEDPDYAERCRAAVRKYDAAHREERRLAIALRRQDPEKQIAEKAYRKRYTAENIEELRRKGREFNQTEYGKQLRRSYRQSHPEVMNEARKRWVGKNREKARAHWAVKYALKTGKLTPAPCQLCGVLKAEAHHEDYSRPLDVIWLCRQHHVEADQRRRTTQLENGEQ